MGYQAPGCPENGFSDCRQNTQILPRDGVHPGGRLHEDGMKKRWVYNTKKHLESKVFITSYPPPDGPRVGPCLPNRLTLPHSATRLPIILAELEKPDQNGG